MSQLHVIVCIETKSSTLPNFVVTASTWTSGINSIILNFEDGSYTSFSIQNPDNDLTNKVCVNVESTSHTPPHVATRTATFDAAIADDCIRKFRHQKSEGKRKYLLDSNSVAFLDRQGCAWYIRVALNILHDMDSMMSVIVKGRELHDDQLPRLDN